MSYRINSRTDAPRNAMLTDAQREYLQGGPEDYTQQNHYDYRTTIADRVHNTILDFQLLADHWDDLERREVFAALLESEEGRAALKAMVALAERELTYDEGCESSE